MGGQEMLHVKGVFPGRACRSGALRGILPFLQLLSGLAPGSFPPDSPFLAGAQGPGHMGGSCQGMWVQPLYDQASSLTP